MAGGAGDRMAKAQKKAQEAQQEAAMQAQLQGMETEWKKGAATIAGYGAGGVGMTGSPTAFAQSRQDLFDEWKRKRGELGGIGRGESSIEKLIRSLNKGRNT